jgi:alpha/beta superfamily hydrolase
MVRLTETIFFDGPAGPIQTLMDMPDTRRGIALVAHPHPLLGGTNNNKVVYTLAHALCDAGFLALRPNFRGVGKSAGTHNQGHGEAIDLVSLITAAKQRWDFPLPVVVVLAGFSFGAYVQTHVAKNLLESGQLVQRLILVGLAVGQLEENRLYEPAKIPPESMLIHGDQDTVVPLSNVLSYAKSLDLPVTLIPGADHFFHGRLALLKRLVRREVDHLPP